MLYLKQKNIKNIISLFAHSFKVKLIRIIRKVLSLFKTSYSFISLKLNSTFWTWFFIVSGFVVSLLAYLNDRGIFPIQAQSNQNRPLEDFNQYHGCIFQNKFDSAQLNILILRFEDYANNSLTECYGRSIESRIDIIKSNKNLPVKICYTDDFSANQQEEANRIGKLFNADLVVWGKLRNASENCSASGICLNYAPSDSLVYFAGGGVSFKNSINNKYESNISAEKIEDGMINMGDESLDSWLFNMINLKIGKKKPDFFTILDSWPKEKQEASYFVRGNLFYSIKKYDRAIFDLEKAIQTPKYSLPASIILVYSLINENKNIEALDILKKMEEKNDSSFVLAHNIGYVYSSLNKKNKAIEYFKKAISLNINSESSYTSLANSFLELKKPDSALLSLQINPQQYQDKFAYYSVLGRTYSLLHDHTKSIEFYSKAIQINPNNSTILNNRGNIYLEIKDYAKAEKDYIQVCKLDPNEAISYLNLGNLYSVKQDFKKSIFYYSKTLEIYNLYKEALIGRAQAYHNLGNLNNAYNDYLVSLKFDSSALTLGRMADIKHRQGDIKSALSLVDASVRLWPNNSEAHNTRGSLLRKIKKQKEAVESFNKAIDINPNVSAFYNNRNCAFVELNQPNYALKDINKAIELEPENSLYYLNRSRLYQIKGEKNKAFIDELKAYYFRNKSHAIFTFIFVLFGILLTFKWKKIYNLLRLVFNKIKKFRYFLVYV